MGVTLKKQRDGTLRPFWYGEYQEGGNRRVVNLNVPVHGNPPASLSLKDTGDTHFEKSRDKAEETLAAHVEEARHKGRAEHLTERLIESKTGRAVEYASITDLPNLWRNMGRDARVKERYLAACDAAFNRFAAFIQAGKKPAEFLYEVTRKDAAAFVKQIQTDLAHKTAHDTVRLLHTACTRFLPVGAENPFAAFIGRRVNGDNGTIHRKPFSPEELQALLDAASKDDFMHPLITAAACTGMRRADVCKLQWNTVDWQEGMLTVKTSKTGAEVEIPIFRPLLAVLNARKSNGSKYVFPRAERMLRRNPDGLTRRFKKIAAIALNEQEPVALPPAVSFREIEKKGTAAIRKRVSADKRRDRMLDVLRRYCAGESVRDIAAETGYAKSMISTDLHAVQDWLGKGFMRTHKGLSLQADIARLTRVERPHGQRAASVRDWHALRATFVTLALAAGVPVELVRRVTGHATVDIVLKHYFRPDRAQFKAALAAAMPGVLTGKRIKLKPADELAALAGKLAAGTATEKDKARLRKLAAKV